ncbi:MAG TPA: sugar ABC transporter ATP-binding protein [Candidatus Baltobacteraceae bacterium]|jgi:ribose transport system ATP-binding protein|nr:sugar ABC transporter ATP-binding protein [Candidatus Baltobacteraceae bacterium]
MTPEPEILRVDGLQKSYNAPVLLDFHFDLRAGEVHALIGGNGAGKSTFARILAGLTARNGGQIQFCGEPYIPKSKRDAESAGVVMVLQELNVIGASSVAENIFLNRLPRRGGFVRFTDLREMARQALARVGLNDLDPGTPASQLGIGQQQLVEIAGALARDCRLLILDEPTAALTNPEIVRLFENIRRLQTEGVGVIYVSHRMDEILRVANRVTVMRDGRRIATHETDKVTPPQLILEMAGHGLPERRHLRREAGGQVALDVRHLSAGPRVCDVSFQVRRGEILGLAGLVGSGRTETLRAVFGAEPSQSGEILVGGRTVVIRSPADAVRAGLGLVPEDRKQDALFLTQSIRVNTTIATLGLHSSKWGWLNERAETETSEKLSRRLQVQCASLNQAAGELSGGNQQKIVLARWLARDGSILLLDEPTRGIDVTAKETIYEVLRELARSGKAIVVVSSELEELMMICDRLLVMSKGTIAAEFLAGEWTHETITRAAFSGCFKPGEDAIQP